MKGRAVRRRLGYLLVVVLVGLVLVHPMWLTAMGDFLVARDELAAADAIVVLAGNSPYRARHAVELYRDGWAPRVIFSNELVQSHGVEATWTDLRGAGLVQLDLPEEAVVALPEIARSTYHEALESRRVMLEHGWKRAILVTDPFHMRRATLAFRGVWSQDGLEIIASAAEKSKYTVSGWWTDPNKATRIVQEYVKFPYYLLAGQF